MGESEEGPILIAHRGACTVAPENTRSAIAEAVRLGAKVVEFDVRVSADGELVVFHDDSLERIIGRKGTIEASKWEDLQSMDVGHWFGDGDFAGENLILLKEAIEICLAGDAIPLIEHKSGEAAAYLRIIDDLKARESVIVQSFNWKFLADFSTLASDVRLGALASKKLDGDRKARLSELRPRWVGWKEADMKNSYIEWFHELDCKIALWTVNDPAVAKRWVDAGVDAIITDCISEMQDAFALP